MLRSTKQSSSPGPWVGKGGGGSPSAPIVVASYNLLPATAAVGTTAWVGRILGGGYFEVMYNGTRWAVVPGQDPARLETEISLTAVGTTYVQLVNVVVGPLVGDYETWLFRAAFRSGGVFTLRSTMILRTIGSASNLGNACTVNNAAHRGRKIGAFRRYGGTVQRVAGQPESYAEATRADAAVSDWNLFSVECGVAPGAIGDTLVLEEFSLIRES